MVDLKQDLNETAQDDNAILTQAISDLQCSTTINSFFNTAKEKQLYKFLVEIYRDEVQKSLKSDKSTMKIFLKIMHRELALHSSFEFNNLKLKNIISCTSYRNNKINSGRKKNEGDSEIISKFISSTKKLEEFHLYFLSDISKLEILKNNFNEIFQFWSLKEKKRKRPGLDLAQIDLALKKIEFFYEKKCIENSTSVLTSYFEKVVNFICDKLNMNDNLVSPFSSVGVNKNGIFSTIE
uniref:Uncharacterized protein n=1 Tax=Strongyloides venezuelensis TaxID=75913 RepID=A0A0K0FTH3_STRVS